MLTRKHFLSVITLGAPLLAGMVSEFFMYIADSAMVGRLGTNHLAAIAIATLYGEIMWVMVWPFAPGTQALAARRYGQLQAAASADESTETMFYRKTGNILDNSLVIAFSVGIATMLTAVFSEQVLNLLLDDQQLIPLAESYIRIIKYVMPLAAVFYSLFILNRTLVGGFAEGGSVLIGNHIGRGEHKEALRYAYATLYIAFFFGVLLMIVLWVFPASIVKIFNQEPETVALGAEGLRFFMVFIFINIIAFPFEIIFTHNGWGKFPLITELISIITFALGLTLLLTRYFNMGIYAAWLSLGLYMLCYSVLLFGGFMSKRWLHVAVENVPVSQ